MDILEDKNPPQIISDEYNLQVRPDSDINHDAIHQILKPVLAMSTKRNFIGDEKFVQETPYENKVKEQLDPGITHVNTIHQTKQHSCEECKKSFTTKKGLNAHTKTNAHIKTAHQNLRHFSCLECKKSFVKRSVFIDHAKTIHQNQKPFSCQECEKSYGSERALELHVKITHQNLKLFSCQECEKSYISINRVENGSSKNR